MEGYFQTVPETDLRVVNGSIGRVYVSNDGYISKAYKIDSVGNISNASIYKVMHNGYTLCPKVKVNEFMKDKRYMII